MATFPPYPTAAKQETSVIFPDGTQIFVAKISSIQITTGAPTVVNVGIGTVLNAYSFTASSEEAAIDIRAQITDALSGTQTGTVILSDSSTGLAFTSVTPNTYTIPSAAQDFVIAGTGFGSSGINQLVSDNGIPGQKNYYVPIIDNDAQMRTGSVTFDNPGVYTIYYSLDHGATFTTTGLTITVT